MSIDGSGNFTFDQTKFLAAFDANPDGVIKMFTQGGTSSNSSLQFVSAGDLAVAGTYDVNVTHAATQAAATGLTGVFPPVALPTVTVNVGTTQVSYAVKNTDSRADVASRRSNAAFANAKLNFQATDTGSGVQIQSEDYGAKASFSVDWGDGNGSNPFAGTDVAGTIGGITATGNGQQLLVPFANNTIGGLAIKVTSNATGDLGNFTYVPGVAQRVVTSVTQAADPIVGTITSVEKDFQARIKYDNDQIAQMEIRINAYEVSLRQQWTELETTISQLKSQSSWLTQSDRVARRRHGHDGLTVNA